MHRSFSVVKKRTVAEVIADWEYAYFTRKGRVWRDEEKKKIHSDLSSLGQSATEDDIAKIIGNKSWTRNECFVCDRDKEKLVTFVHYDDLMLVCSECLSKAANELAKE